MKAQAKPTTSRSKGKSLPRHPAPTARVQHQVEIASQGLTRRAHWKIPAVVPVGSLVPVSKTLPLAVKRIAETLHPEKIILFGSYAYGKPTPDSDVDLLVVMNTSASRIDRYLAVSRCLRPRPFSVDIVVKTPDEIRSAIEMGDFFIKEIYTRGKPLYETPE